MIFDYVFGIDILHDFNLIHGLDNEVVTHYLIFLSMDFISTSLMTQTSPPSLGFTL